MKNIGIAVWWSLSGNQPNYSFSWQVLVSQVLIFTQQVYNWYNHVLTCSTIPTTLSSLNHNLSVEFLIHFPTSVASLAVHDRGLRLLE